MYGLTDLRLGEKKFKVRRFFFVALLTLLYNLRLVKWAQNKAIIEFVLFWGFLQVRNSNNPISGFVLFAIRDFSSVNQFHVKNSVAEKIIYFYSGNRTARPFFEKRLDFKLILL